MAPELDVEIEGMVRAGASVLAGERVLETYGGELYGFLLHLLGEAEAGEAFSQVAEDLGGALPSFTFWCSTRTLLYRLARRATRSRRTPFTPSPHVAAARTTQVHRKPPDDRIVALRKSLEPDDRILLTLRVDRAFAWDDLARVLIDADEPDGAMVSRESDRLRERFVALKGELAQRLAAQGSGSEAPPLEQTVQDLAGAVIGNYRIIDLLGGGGMGVVWRAEHTTLGRKAVIKFIQDELVEDPAHARRFFLEAKTAASIRHPGIVEVFDYTTDGRGRPYIAMELLDGESLRDRMEREGPLAIDVALAVASQTAAAVGAAHAAGVVHRDLKPDNLFLVPDLASPHGLRVKVLDFGLAKVTTSTEPGVTRTGNLVGTPRYMSPEQCRQNATVDPRSDVYALGCILFEMVCGRGPFLERTVGELIIAHTSLPPPTPSSLASAIRPALDRAILRALAKQPDDRFGSMAELGSALAQLADAGSAPALADTAVARPVAPVPAAPPQPRPSQTWWLGLAIALVAVALLALVLVVLR